MKLSEVDVDLTDIEVAMCMTHGLKDFHIMGVKVLEDENGNAVRDDGSQIWKLLIGSDTIGRDADETDVGGDGDGKPLPQFTLKHFAGTPDECKDCGLCGSDDEDDDEGEEWQKEEGND